MDQVLNQKEKQNVNLKLYIQMDYLDIKRLMTEDVRPPKYKYKRWIRIQDLLNHNYNNNNNNFNEIVRNYC